MKKTAIIAFLYLLTLGLSFGQENKTKTISPKRKLYVEDQAQVNVSSKPAFESAYFGYDHKIAAISLNNAIPAGFPTKEGYPTKEQYRTVINKWLKDNPAFIKPEHKETVITDK
ncbi:MAG: hypothetical protein SGJ15_06880 [Bacteroidota bacterium]|nr:hypothetical protein [Bacteroidota bacterium]